MVKKKFRRNFFLFVFAWRSQLLDCISCAAFFSQTWFMNRANKLTHCKWAARLLRNLFSPSTSSSADVFVFRRQSADYSLVVLFSSDVTLSRSLVDLVRRTFYGATHQKCSMMWRHLRQPSSDRIYIATTSVPAPRSIVNTTLWGSLTQTTSKSLDSSKRSSLYSRTNIFCSSEIRLHLFLDENHDLTSMHLE